MPLTLKSPSLGLASQAWRMPPGISTTTDRTLATSAHVTAWPFFFGTPTALDRLRIYLTTAQTGAEAMAGLYSNDGRGRPLKLLADFGTKDLSTGSGSDIDWTISITASGWVWALIWIKNVATQVTVKGPSASASFSENDAAATTLSGAITPKTNLALTAAYPASMPAAAPAVVPITTVSFALPMLRAV